MESTEPRTVDAQIVEAEITKELGDVLNAVQQIAVVKDDQSRAVAVQFGVRLTEKAKALKELRKRIVDPIRKAYENARDTFDGKLDAIEAGKKLLSARVSAYDIEQERIAREERERLEAERRERQRLYELEQARYKMECDHVAALQDNAEWERQAAERRAKADRDAKLKDEQDARIRQAETAQGLGMGDRVDTILDKATAIAPTAPSIEALQTATAKPIETLPMIAPPPPPPPPPPPAPVPAIIARRADPNSVSRDEWKFELDSIVKLAAAVAEGRAPAEYLTINRGEVGKDVRRLKDQFACDGVKTWKERNTTFRTGKAEEGA